jgi:tetratricopeptide (TPR) repeat protein
VKNDPHRKHFNIYYEIQLYGKHDFIFDFKNEIPKNEFMQKTSKLRQFPYHLKNTLFASDEIKELRQKEFAFIYYRFDELKVKGNKLFKRAKFREAMQLYIDAYSLLKWIEFNDSLTKNYTKILRENIPILDEDITEGKCSKLNWMTNAIEEDSYRFCIVNLLLSMSYVYIELRHYSSAISSLDECLTYADDNAAAEIYFRRSQARTYNKYSDLEQLLIALADIQRALSLSNSKIYYEHYEILQNLINRSKKNEKEKLTSKIILIYRFPM